MIRPLSAFTACVVALSLTACSAPPAEPVSNAPGDIAAINTLRSAFQSAWTSGDAAALGNLYTADAVSMTNHQPTGTGRDAIVASLRAQFEQMSGTMELTPDETRTMGSFGFDRGRFKITLTPKAGGPAITDEGRYLVLLEKGADGAWKVSRDIDNSSLPMPMPTAPAHEVPVK